MSLAQVFELAVTEGLHPWEFDGHNMQTLVWRLHGLRTRHAQLQYGSRQIWIYVHNFLCKTKYRTPEQVHKVWPLYTDEITNEAEAEINMLEKYREMKAKLEAKNAKING